MSEQPRGIRNHNPGNLRWGVPWLGLLAEDRRTDPDFAQFIDAWHGIRALSLNLLDYEDEHHLDTVAGIIARWCPPGKNDTADYIYGVASALGVAPDDVLDLSCLTTLMPLVRAIIHHEQGPGPLQREHWYPDYMVTAGCQAALDYAAKHFDA